MAVTKIGKLSNSVESEYSPSFELDEYGPEVTDHNGISWMQLTCPHCLARTKFKPVHLVIIEGKDEHGADEKIYHYLCQCESCSDIIYAKFAEWSFDPDWLFQYELHSPISSVKREASIPKLAWLPFYEANKCLNVGAYLATVVMCRRTIEAILKDQGASPDLSLYKSIENLPEDSIIQGSMKHLADLVRIVGNIGAHSTEMHINEGRAREVYELTKKLIDIAYIIPANVKGAKAEIEKDKEKIKIKNKF